MRRIRAGLDPVRALAPLLPRLVAYAWPGNVRELENLAERIAVFLLQFDRLEDIRYDEVRHDLPELFVDAAGVVADCGLTDAGVAAALNANRGNRQAAARQLGVSRSTLWRWMRDHGAGTTLA
jgi:propionate catabolism operon transcriptional regulator